MKCKDCGGPVIQLFTGVACKNECDLHPYTEGDGSYEEYSADDWDASDDEFIYPVYRDSGTPTRVMLYTGSIVEWKHFPGKSPAAKMANLVDLYNMGYIKEIQFGNPDESK